MKFIDRSPANDIKCGHLLKFGKTGVINTSFLNDAI